MCFDKTPKHLIICIGTKVKIHTILILFVLLCWTELNFINLISLSWWKKKNSYNLYFSQCPFSNLINFISISWCYLCYNLQLFTKTTTFFLFYWGVSFEFLQVYLSLPNSKSLCEGHCLIVPMQHAVSGTVVDEDVWNEIQVSMITLSQTSCEIHHCVIIVRGSLHWNFLYLSLKSRFNQWLLKIALLQPQRIWYCRCFCHYGITTKKYIFFIGTHCLLMWESILNLKSFDTSVKERKL